MSIEHLLCFLLLLAFFLCIHGGEPGYSLSCPTKACNGIRISYPFWLIDDGSATNGSKQNLYCGYLGFGLSCPKSNNIAPILALPDNNYYVKNIDYSTQSITLVDHDVVGKDCPRLQHNVTIDSLPLHYNRDDVNITFYFNCSFGESGPPQVSPIPCLANSGKSSYVVLDGAAAVSFDRTGKCEEVVVTAVRLKTVVSELELMDQFIQAMNSGFVLNWNTAKECRGCESTGGRCGFNNRTKEVFCFCDDGSIHRNLSSNYCRGRRIAPRKLVMGIGIALGTITLSVATGVYWLRKRNSSYLKGKGHSKADRDIENFISDNVSLARRFTYAAIKRMTNSFSEKLGQGGFGSVYKGKLSDGTVVAVKLWDSTKGSGQEFINEVAGISRTSHVNIVTLLGFCFDGRKRAVIYEFMPNGSLDRYIHNENAKSDMRLGWEKLYQIAVGIARGLEYLHRGCNTRILHFDIKPHNILLDREFNPKISDFGLSKLCLERESTMSMVVARGTIGYIAPEVFNRNFGRVSYKSDVYSYGMMLIEMIVGRNNLNVRSEQSNEIYFSDWVYRLVEQGYDWHLHGEILEEEVEMARKMALVGLWCIQTDPTQRPSMSRVIDMLEGTIDSLQIPPKPFLSSPHRSPIDSSLSTPLSL